MEEKREGSPRERDTIPKLEGPLMRRHRSRQPHGTDILRMLTLVFLIPAEPCLLSGVQNMRTLVFGRPRLAPSRVPVCGPPLRCSLQRRVASLGAVRAVRTFARQKLHVQESIVDIRESGDDSRPHWRNGVAGRLGVVHCELLLRPLRSCFDRTWVGPTGGTRI